MSSCFTEEFSVLRLASASFKDSSDIRRCSQTRAAIAHRISVNRQHRARYPGAPYPHPGQRWWTPQQLPPRYRQRGNRIRGSGEGRGATEIAYNPPTQTPTEFTNVAPTPVPTIIAVPTVITEVPAENTADINMSP
jgi:hypothetical protein